MRRWFALSALVAGGVGCFAPTAPIGARCAGLEAIERCPAGLVCVAHDGIETCELTGTQPDARSDDAAVAGSDAPTACAGADEDGDGLGDTCDPCPPVADNTDTDADGVGDACDPNPTAPGDKLVAFHGFASPLPPGWTSSGLVMTNGGDGALIAGDDATSLLSVSSPVASRVEIRAAFVIDLITASGNNLGSISLIDRLQPNTDRSIACQLSGLVDGTQEELRIFDANAIAVVTRAPHGFAPGMETELRLRRSGTSYGCRVTGPVQELTGTATFAPASPRIGMRAHGAAARFHWVMLVTSPAS